MQHILFVIFLFISSSIFALLEIQIEGKHGWAGALPTWRIKPKTKGLLRLFATPERPITGYHVYSNLLHLLIPHIVFFFVPWTFTKELFIVAYFLFFIGLEDFLYFIYSPYWGWKKFRKENIQYHTVWFIDFPLLYWFDLPIAIIFYLIGTGVL